MADMLKFRKGTYAQINSAAKVAGTIYIAKDEKAMYVDIKSDVEGVGGERIRIGDFIRVDTVKDITPPYSTSSLYYVEADNALLKYDGSVWKQVNGTDDIRASIESLSEAIAANTAAIGDSTNGLTKAVADNKAAIEANAEAIEANASVIEDLKAAIGMNDEGEVEGLAGSVAALTGRVTTAEGEIDALQELTATHTSDIADLKTESAKHVTKTEAEAFAKTADIQATLNKIDTTGTVSAAIDAAVLVETNRAKAAEEANTNAIAGVKATADSAVQTATFNAFKVENTTAIGNAKTEAVAAAGEYTDGKISAEVTRADSTYATKSELEGVNNTVAGHTSALEILNGADSVNGSVANAKKAGTDAAALAAQKTTMADVEAKNYATKTEAQGYANAKDAAITAAANAAAAAQGDATNALNAIGDTTKGLVKDVADNKAAAAAAQKTIDDYVTAHASDYTNAQVDAEVKKASDAATAASQAAAAAQSTANQGVTDAAAAKSAADAAQATANAAVTKTDFETFKGTNTFAIADAKKAGTDAAAVAEANGQLIAGVTARVKAIEDAPYVTKAQLTEAKSDLEGEIDKRIDAANAMTFKKSISKESDLPTEDVKNGDTYVVAQGFTSADGTVYYAGDLVIAKGEETDGVITSDLSWDRVQTGYSSTLDPKLTGTNNEIALTSLNGNGNVGDLGKIAFVADANTSASVSVSNHTVTIGMVWEDFE